MSDITITWDVMTGATSYDIYYIDGAVGNESAAKIVAEGIHFVGVANPAGTVISGLTPGNLVIATVTQTNTFGTSFGSEPETKLIIPAGPTSISAAQQPYNKRAVVSWDEMNGATSYTIWYLENAIGTENEATIIATGKSVNGSNPAGTIINVLTYSQVRTTVTASNGTGTSSGGTPYNTTIIDGRTLFISTWQTDAAGFKLTNDYQIKLPLTAGSAQNFTVFWGDGSSDVITAHNQAETTHTYSAIGVYEVAIVGSCTNFGFSLSAGDNAKLLDVKQWGNVLLHNSTFKFYSCDNLVKFSAKDAPDLSAVTSMYGAFEASPLFESGVAHWDVSNITNMSLMFRYASAFNEDISSWDTSSVYNMAGMFGSTTFNQDIDSWDVSSVLDMSYMFQSSLFNKSLNSWDVSSVQYMTQMFYNSAYNQNISGWQPTSVTTMASMFRNSPFNQPIGAWVVSSVGSMSYMFAASSFNQNIGGWTITSVSDIGGMFETNSAFDQDISGWDVSNVTSLFHTFYGASSFNQDISGWNVSSVENMVSTFQNATSFDQNLGAWDISGITVPSSMNLMFSGVTMSTVNYSNTLIGWAANPSIPAGVTLSGGNSKYNAGGQAARNTLTGAPNNWSITDAGLE